MSSKKAKNVSSAFAVATLDNVPSVLDALNKEIADLKHIQETAYKTTGLLDGFGDIRQETLLTNLIRAASMVLAKETAYNNAATWMKLTTYPPFEINGYCADSWIQDILLRKAVIEHKDRLDKLNEFKEKMSKFLSEEDQKAILYKEMAKFLNIEA